MDRFKENAEFLKQFISCYEKFQDKEAFISMWKEILNMEDEKPYTLEDAYDNAYGMALAQL